VLRNLVKAKMVGKSEKKNKKQKNNKTRVRLRFEQRRPRNHFAGMLQMFRLFLREFYNFPCFFRRNQKPNKVFPLWPAARREILKHLLTI